jgi:hypothetical protein
LGMNAGGHVFDCSNALRFDLDCRLGMPAINPLMTAFARKSGQLRRGI